MFVLMVVSQEKPKGRVGKHLLTKWEHLSFKVGTALCCQSRFRVFRAETISCF